jgi:hypothetical protein
VVLSVLGKAIQSNASFGLTNRLEVHLDNMRMSVGNGNGVKPKRRSLDVLSAIKNGIVVVKVANQCLAYALVIAMPR